MRGTRALAAVMAMTVTMGLAGRADAQAGYETFDVSIGPVSEGDRHATVTVTTSCQNEISFDYAVGRRAPDSATPVRDSFDARGEPATANADYRSSSGTFTVSKAKPVTLEVPVVDDAEVESLEHVVILFESANMGAMFAGDLAACENQAEGRHYVESAFTIVDNDERQPSASNGSASPRPAEPTSPKPAAGGTSAATPRQPGAGSGPSASIAAAVAADVPADELEPADGLELIGAAAARKPDVDNRPERGSSSGVLAGAALLVLTVSVAGVLLARRRRGW